MNNKLTFVYKNYKGNINTRNVIPKRLYYGCTPYHKEEQWLMEAYDLDKKATRVFAMRDMSHINN